jgi:hypothetical protein
MTMRNFILIAVMLAPATARAQPITHPADSLPDRLQPTVTTSSDPPVEPRHLWIVGVLATPDQARYGLRLQADLFTAGNWSFGVAGIAMQTDTTMMTTGKSFAGEGYVAHTTDLFGPLHLRAQVGAGIGTESSFVDASVAATLSFGDRLGLVAGPIVQLGAGDPVVGFLGLQFR